MPGIRSLEISGEYSTAFANGMVIPDAPGTTSHPLFPVLRDISLRHLWFRPTPYVDDISAGENLIERLGTGVRQRL
ncbi:hypothetical protein NEOLEDRAFT_1143447 [Neolentinus lepideus HHB14362 ss-1]|uniref:Uncharacterized protein n=1 Tax=Neolentinus lepideus HHB14362 ss-1 TaxID=1314782 RepID=A0A165MIN2_9AGAM|nr:hypothetical protein NEOLEDRAFT_1143447 [Neolentinus lepideus HHB14362 ss-1]